MSTSTAVPSIPKDLWTVDLSHVFENAPPIAVDFKRAAQMTSVSRSTLRRFAKSGRLRTVLLGRRRVIPIDALKDLIRNGSGEAEERA
jgi:excisionase family DNA binding protein